MSVKKSIAWLLVVLICTPLATAWSTPVFAQSAPASNISLDFSTALANTIADKDGEGTGFSSLQPNAVANQYDPSRIDLDTATGILTLTATQGSNTSSNTLKNALQLPVDSTRPFSLHTRLRGPLTNLSTAYQQGGLYLGTDQDNYVKFVIVNTSSGNGSLGLQFYQEQNSVRSNVGSSGPQVRGLNWTSITTLDLYLKGDPATGVITAAYRINSDTSTPVTLAQQFIPSPAMPFFADETTARAGILTYTTEAADVAVRFDAFNVEYLTSGVTPSSRPRVTGTLPASGATDVPRDTAVSVDVALPNPGAGVEERTLNTDNVQLFRSSDTALVPGAINTSGGGDVIVYQPSVLLDASTNYTFKVTEGVTDQASTPFEPFSMTFKTGTTTNVTPTPGVSFTQSEVYSGAALTSLLIGPDSNLYAASLDGTLYRWAIDNAGNLTTPETFTGLAGRAIIGLAFDPTNPRTLWVSHNDTIFVQPAQDFTGKISKLTLSSAPAFEATVQDYVSGLPRSAKDHLTNSLAFGPDGLLYLTQGSNSAMGAPDNAWYNRPERLLSAAVLQIDPRRTSALPIDVQTENYEGKTGTYNPYAADAPVKLYGTGIRNAYDLVWHSNGFLYVPTNGSAAGGNIPASPSGVTPVVPQVRNAPTQNDFLFKVQQGGYYGHPNPLRSQYAMNGANPTSGTDPAEVVSEGSNSGYPVNVQPDSNYRGFDWNFGRNRSPNGAIQYKSNAFAGALKNKLLVVEYSAGDDILALSPGANGSIVGVTQVISGLSDPIDLIEDTRNGNLYVAELLNKGASGRISLLRVQTGTTGTPNLSVAPAQLVFNTVQGTTSPTQTITLTNTGDADLRIEALALEGADQFTLRNQPTLPLTLTPEASATVSVQFNPTSVGTSTATLQIQSTDSNSPQTSVALQGTGTQPAGGDGKLQVVTPDADIVSHRIVLSTVNEVARTKTMTLTNTGSGPLSISGLSFGNSREEVNGVRTADYQRATDFRITSAPTLPFTLAAGETRSLTVQFTPQRVSSIDNGATYLLNGENYAALTITSDDPASPTFVVDLAGANFANFEGNNEPSIAEMARIFGWTLNVGTEKLKLGGAKKLLGDEVYSPNWVRADSSRPVLMWPLAVTSGRGDNPHGTTSWSARTGSGGNSGTLYTFAGRANDDSPTGTEAPGSNDVSGGENQKLLPKVLVSGINTTPSTAMVDFVPSTAFTLNNSGTHTDDARNGSGQLHNWRMFPVRDQSGTLIPHYWYGVQDIGNTEGGAKNYDYNDHVYLIVNARPENAALDPSVASLLPGAPGLVLDFDTAYSGTLADKDGQTTGFTSVQLNENDSYTASSSFNPALIDIDPTAGTLTLTTTAGSNANTNNTLVNGLLRSFDSRAGKFALSTTLRGPLNTLATANQQAGVMLGPDQDNYVKLVATAQSNGKLGLQWFWEKKASGANVGSIVTISNASTLQTLELRLIGDPKAATLQAAYRAIYSDGTDTGLVFLPGVVQLAGGQIGHYFAAQGKAGLITSHINATALNVVFERFAVTPEETP
ncbi:MAG: choice-of-anchor D domain-containing protein [Gemmatimonadaceae bacterium]|nr:choice-of-anchor D domain-containing protein [Gloeobacterales cyanobacterium ES-bin-141]